MSEQSAAQSRAISPYEQLKGLVKDEEIVVRFSDALGTDGRRFLASVVNTVGVTPSLREAEPHSILQAAMQAALYRLAVDPSLGQAWIIPYKSQGKKMARFQVGWKGYVQLALRTGQYTDINVTEVFEGEKIIEDRITGRCRLEGVPVSSKVTDYISYFRMKSGYESYYHRTVEQVRQHAMKYSQSWGDAKSAWTTHFDEMAKKTVLMANLRKFGSLSPVMIEVIKTDADLPADIREPEPVGMDASFDRPTPGMVDGEMRDAPDIPAALVEAKLSENLHSAKSLVDKYMPEYVRVDLGLALGWAELYRERRNAGDAPADAALFATTQIDLQLVADAEGSDEDA